MTLLTGFGSLISPSYQQDLFKVIACVCSAYHVTHSERKVEIRDCRPYGARDLSRCADETQFEKVRLRHCPCLRNCGFGQVVIGTLYGLLAGGAVGVVIRRFAIFPTGDRGAYALVGMGALFAGIIRAPITSVFMIFELTQDYQILVPLMIANMLSFLISRRYQPRAVHHALLDQDQVHLPEPGGRAAASRLARDIMTRNLTFIPAGTSVEGAWKLAAKNPSKCFLVGSQEMLTGLVTRQSIEEAMQSGKASEPVTSLLVRAWAHVHPDHSLELALERFRQNPGLLLVLSRGGTYRVEGVITLDTIMRFVETNRQE